MLALDEVKDPTALRSQPRNGHELVLLVRLTAAFDVGDGVEDLLQVLGDLRGESVDAGKASVEPPADDFLLDTCTHLGLALGQPCPIALKVLDEVLENGRVGSNLDSLTRLFLAGDEVGEFRVGDLVEDAAARVDESSVDDDFEVRYSQIALSVDDLGLEGLDLVGDAADLSVVMALPQQAFVMLVDLVFHLPLLHKVD